MNLGDTYTSYLCPLPWGIQTQSAPNYLNLVTFLPQNITTHGRYVLLCHHIQELQS